MVALLTLLISHEGDIDTRADINSAQMQPLHTLAYFKQKLRIQWLQGQLLLYILIILGNITADINANFDV